jgi:hypothetical protein
MGISRIFFGIFNRIDFETIAFEGRKQCFFRAYLAGSAAFDSHLRHKLEVHKVELLEIHNVWHVRYLWKNLRSRGTT